MQLLRNTSLILLALVVAPVALHAQVYIGQDAASRVEVVDATGQSTGATVQLKEGGNAYVENKMSASITVRIYDGANLVAQVGVLPGQTWSGPHGLEAGSYTYTVTEANGESEGAPVGSGSLTVTS